MESQSSEYEQLRPVIGWTVAGCLAVAMAPWLSGGQEPVGQLISGFALLLGTVLLVRQPRVRRLKFGPLVLAYYAFIGWGVLSLVWSANRYSTLEWLILVVAAGLGFRLAYALSGEAPWRQRLVRLYLGSAAAFAIFGWYVYLTSGYDRFTGSFYWPNPAAAYLMPAGVLAYDRWRRGGHWIQLVLIGLVGSGFVLADSRATEAVAVVVGLVYIWKVTKNKRFWITFVFSLIAIVLLSLGAVALRHSLQPHVATTTPGSRLAPASASNEQSGNDRIEYLKSVASIWSHHPLLGTGAGTFADVHPQYQGRVISASTSAHNVYAQTLAELGLPGALLLLGLLVMLAAGTLRGLWHYGEGWVVVLVLGGVWLHFGLDIDAQYPAMVLLVSVLGGAYYYQRPAWRRLEWRPLAASVALLLPVAALYLSDARTQQGRAAQDNGDYELAESDFAAAHSFGVYNPDVLTAQGIDAYTLAGQNSAQQATALKLARAAEHQDPADAQHYQLEGRVLAAQNRFPEAEAAFRAALYRDPYNHPEYAYDLAQVQLHRGDANGALTTARSMLRQYPAGVIANRAADTTVAPNLATLEVLIGSVLLQQGDVPGARAASDRALKIDSGNLRAQALHSLLQQVETGSSGQ